jgi:hypothetical protein
MQVAAPINTFGRHVPTDPAGLQVEFGRWMGTARIIIPPSPTTTIARTIRSLVGPLYNTLSTVHTYLTITTFLKLPHIR